MPHSLRIVAILMCTTLLTACGTHREGNVLSTMSNKDFVAKSSEERLAYLDAVKAEEMVLQEKRNIEYAAGRPVYFGNPETGYTVMWDPKLQIIYIMPGNNPGAFSIESEGIMAFRSDDKGNILYQNIQGIEQPMKLLANVGTQEGTGRVFVKGLFGVLSAVTNGVAAAAILRNADCDNCGGDVDVKVDASSASTAKAKGYGGQATGGPVTVNPPPSTPNNPPPRGDVHGWKPQGNGHNQGHDDGKKSSFLKHGW